MSPQDILLAVWDLIILAHPAGDQSEFCKIDKHPWANRWIGIYTALISREGSQIHTSTYVSTSHEKGKITIWKVCHSSSSNNGTGQNKWAAFVHEQDTCRIVLVLISISRYVDKQILFKWHLSAHIKVIGAIIVPTA